MCVSAGSNETETFASDATTFSMSFDWLYTSKLYRNRLFSCSSDNMYWSLLLKLAKLYSLSVIFTARRSYASAVLGVVILSVRPYLCLSVARLLYDKTKQYTTDSLIPHERAITVVFWHQQWLVGDVPFRLKFALKLTHTPSKNADFDRFLLITSQLQEIAKKSSITTNRKSSTGLPTSYRWSA